MKRIIKVVKRIFLFLLALVALFTLAVVIFVNVAPQIGNAPEGKDLERISSSEHFEEGIFINETETTVGDFWSLLGTMSEYMSLENGSPADTLPVKFGEDQRMAEDTLLFVTWYGHSAFLFEMDGHRILIDPMLSEYAAPVSFGSKRFPYEKPIPIEELTDIDALILSHDHYDHLDYETVLQLQEEVGHFYTALGVGSHLKSWGISEEKITELDWWETDSLGDLAFTATPARHFSGRGLTDRNATLWASWVIESPHHNIYFSGDGGYGEHFSEIGNKYGPFDIAFMECGQYNEAWGDIHMMPEESVQAGVDVKGKLLMPIHWGAFQLAIHEWTDPIERFKTASDSLNAPIIHPYIGERFCVGVDQPREPWWE